MAGACAVQDGETKMEGGKILIEETLSWAWFRHRLALASDGD